MDKQQTLAAIGAADKKAIAAELKKLDKKAKKPEDLAWPQLRQLAAALGVGKAPPATIINSKKKTVDTTAKKKDDNKKQTASGPTTDGKKKKDDGNVTEEHDTDNDEDENEDAGATNIKKDNKKTKDDKKKGDDDAAGASGKNKDKGDTDTDEGDSAGDKNKKKKDKKGGPDAMSDKLFEELLDEYKERREEDKKKKKTAKKPRSPASSRSSSASKDDNSRDPASGDKMERLLRGATRIQWRERCDKLGEEEYPVLGDNYKDSVLATEVPTEWEPLRRQLYSAEGHLSRVVDALRARDARALRAFDPATVWQVAAEVVVFRDALRLHKGGFACFTTEQWKQRVMLLSAPRDIFPQVVDGKTSFTSVVQRQVQLEAAVPQQALSVPWLQQQQPQQQLLQQPQQQQFQTPQQVQQQPQQGWQQGGQVRGRAGGFQAQQQLQQQQPYFAVSPRNCYECGQPGHIARKCPKLLAQQQQPQQQLQQQQQQQRPQQQRQQQQQQQPANHIIIN